MGMYTGLQFRGIVKKEYFDDIQKLVNGEIEWSDITWAESLRMDYRSSFIFFGSILSMPDSWKDDEDFELKFDMQNGCLQFQSSVKNYNKTIQRFLAILPIFIESVEICEYFYEESTYSSLYELINEEMIETNDEYELYGYIEDTNYWRP